LYVDASSFILDDGASVTGARFGATLLDCTAHHNPLAPREPKVRRCVRATRAAGATMCARTENSG
jgi:hypothetical protein